MRAAYLLSPSFITQGRMGASRAALILMENSHFDRTLHSYLNFGLKPIRFILILSEKESDLKFTIGCGVSIELS